MATRVLSTRMAIGGESEYKRALKEITSSLKVLKSELALATSRYQEQANSMEALTAKGDVLARMLEAQKTKVQQTSAALQNARNAQAGWTAKVEEARTKLAAAEGELEKLSGGVSAAGKSQEALNAELDTYRRALENAEAGQQAAAQGVNAWQQRLNYAQRDLNELDLELARNRAYLEEARSSADGCAASIDRFGREVREKAQETGTLDGALEDMNAALDNTNTRLELVQKKLEQGWDAKRFDQAQELAQRAISQTEAKAELLRQKLAALEEAGTEQTSAEYQRLEKQLLETEQAAEQARERLQSINQLQLDHLNQGLAEAARRLTGAGTALTAGVTAPLTAAGVAAVRFSSDTQEAINKVEVAFGSAADRVKDWSDTTLTSYGLARGTALDLAALFGDLATSMGFSQDAAADMAMQLVALAGDLASFKNVSVDQAMNALKGIFTGETESLKELGVVMTQANVEAWALEQGIEASYDAMTQAEKVALQ